MSFIDSKFLQQSYVFFEKINVKSNYNLINVTWVIGNSSEGIAYFEYEGTFLVGLLKEKFRLTLSRPADDTDKEYSQVWITMMLDSCKLHMGILPTSWLQTFVAPLASKDNKMKCPIPKGFHIAGEKFECRDTLFPPISAETKFKLKLEFFGLSLDKKKWTPTYNVEIFGRLKK